MKANKVGIIGKKLGMTQLYHEGVFTGVTVIDFSDMEVIGHRTLDKDGYNAVILGCGFKSKIRKDKELRIPRYIREIRLDNTSIYDNYSTLIDTLNSLNYVDVCATSKGKGFAGGMKRWGFGGGRASRGSKVHRRVGSIGQHTFPAKVFKGKRMPGHLGNVKTTILGQRLIRVDADNRLLFIRGSVPGANKGYVIVRDAIKAY